MRLKSKVAIVTGGGTGIGAAIARHFAAEGCAVTITGRRPEVLADVAQAIGKSGGRAIAVPGSVTSEADVRQAVSATVEAFGGIDILVNNAGNAINAGPVHEMTDAAWQETLDVFLTGVFRFSRAAIPHILGRGGSIVNIGSVLGFKAVAGGPVPAYAVAKAGVAMLTKAIAIHYAKDRIRCNCIAPAVVDTPMTTGRMADPATRARFEAGHPLGRLGTPTEIASAAVYFASDEALWTTGSILAVDGGVMAQ